MRGGGGLMRCVICKGEIEKKYAPNAEGELIMYWDEGHNALPVVKGRCCDTCNWRYVIPSRMYEKGYPE